MKMTCKLSFILIILAACAPSLPSSTGTPALSPSKLAPRFRSPTPPRNPGTLIKDEGAFKVLSHSAFYWMVKLPRDWVITYDRGFEIIANNPPNTAFIRLLSQIWDSEKERLAKAKDYVQYWQNHRLGNLFPVYAEGTRVAESEISKDKLGGPYLRYEFSDAPKGVRYLQVYASASGPNSVVLTAWGKSQDFDGVRATLEAILDSLALLK